MPRFVIDTELDVTEEEIRNFLISAANDPFHRKDCAPYERVMKDGTDCVCIACTPEDVENEARWAGMIVKYHGLGIDPMRVLDEAFSGDVATDLITDAIADEIYENEKAGQDGKIGG